MPVRQKAAIRRSGTYWGANGQSYEDKISRRGIRLMDLIDADTFARKLKEFLVEKNFLLEKFLGESPCSFDEIFAEYQGYAEVLRRYVADTSLILNNDLLSGKKALFEGAQGTLLHIDHGTYPFVTSSSTCSGGAATVPVSGRHNKRNNRISKAYVTRVGKWPFPTELEDNFGEEAATDWRRVWSNNWSPETLRMV